MLDRGGDQVLASCGLERLGDAADGEVVAFCPSAREHDLGRLRTDQGCHRAPGLVHGRFGPLPEMMDARRIAEVIPENLRHRLHHCGVDRRRRVVIHVDSEVRVLGEGLQSLFNILNPRVGYGRSSHHVPFSFSTDPALLSLRKFGRMLSFRLSFQADTVVQDIKHHVPTCQTDSRKLGPWVSQGSLS